MGMRLLDRYIGLVVFQAILLVLLILVALFAFFSFIEEASDIGSGQYDTWLALEYVLLQVPRSAYELFPLAALLGSLAGLGILANNSELTVIRAAGVSVLRIYWAVLKLALLMLAAMIWLGETVAPHSEQYARQMRAVARGEQIALQTRHGFWARDGKNFVHIRTILPGGELGDVSLYEFDQNQILKSAAQARLAVYQNDHWMLQDLVLTRVNNGRVETDLQASAEWDSLLSPGLLSILILKPDRLSSAELHKYIGYLKDNNQGAARYELAFWNRVLYPLVTAVMIFLAVPFVFGSPRNVALGQRALAGALIGIVFYLLNQTLGHFSVLYHINPLLSAVLPLALFLGMGVWMLRRLRLA
jgi:lipopolysaccharide export system permease protein